MHELYTGLKTKQNKNHLYALYYLYLGSLVCSSGRLNGLLDSTEGLKALQRPTRPQPPWLTRR